MDFQRFKGALSPTLAPSIKHARHAFVTWVIYDKSYITGALVLGSSLRYHSPGIQRICLLSKDIAETRNCKDLQSVYDVVVLVDLIKAEARHTRWGRFEGFYCDWIDLCFTRLQCLRIGEELDLDKIVVLDADTLAVGDMSPLFDLPTPAGILSFAENASLGRGEEKRMRHKELHGAKIPASYVKLAVRKSYGIRGCLMVLTPRDRDFEYFLGVLKSHATNLKDAVGAYGDDLLHIGPDERLFTEHYQELYGWTHIHQRYCMTAWHLDQLSADEVPVGLHFVSKKPWEFHDEYFSDFDFWYLEALHFLALYPEMRWRFNDSALQKRDVKSFSALSSRGLKRFWAWCSDTHFVSRDKEASGIVGSLQQRNGRFLGGVVMELAPHPLLTLPSVPSDEMVMPEQSMTSSEQQSVSVAEDSKSPGSDGVADGQKSDGCGSKWTRSAVTLPGVKSRKVNQIDKSVRPTSGGVKAGTALRRHTFGVALSAITNAAMEEGHQKAASGKGRRLHTSSFLSLDSLAEETGVGKTHSEPQLGRAREQKAGSCGEGQLPCSLSLSSLSRGSAAQEQAGQTTEKVDEVTGDRSPVDSTETSGEFMGNHASVLATSESSPCVDRTSQKATSAAGISSRRHREATACQVVRSESSLPLASPRLLSAPSLEIPHMQKRNEDSSDPMCRLSLSHPRAESESTPTSGGGSNAAGGSSAAPTTRVTLGPSGPRRPLDLLGSRLAREALKEVVAPSRFSALKYRGAGGSMGSKREQALRETRTT